MAVAFRASTALTGGSGTTAAFTIPTGTTSTDLAVVCLYIETTAAVTKPDATWFEITESPLTLNEGAGSGRLRLYYSLSPATAGSWTFSWTGSAYRSGSAASIQGRTGTGYPFGTASTVENNGGGGTAFTLPAVTIPTTGDGLLVMASENASKDFGAPAGVTERQDNDETYIAVTDNVTAGSTGTKAFSSSAGGDNHAWMAPILQNSGSAATPTEVTYAAHWKLQPPGRRSPAGRLNAWSIPDNIPPGPLFAAVDTAALVLSGVTPTATVPAQDWFTEIGGSTPELIVSSEDWLLLPNATVNNSGDWQQTFDDYFATRAAQGYNAVEVTMFSYPDPSAITSSGQDSDGVWPFAGNSNNPNNAFNTAWTDRRDYFFAAAAANGMRVFCNITTPYVDLGAFTASWTDTQWTNWGTKIGTQWGSVTNVHWMFGDDYFGDKDDQFTLCLNAMRAAGATQDVSIQNHQEMTSRTDIFNGDAKTWGRNHADFDWVYTYNPTYDGIEKAGNDNQTLNPIPYVWGDGLFLQSGTTGITVNQLMRRMVWWALSSGAKGFNIGNNIVYPWDTTAAWTEVQTNTWYTTTVGNIVDAFTALPKWWLLKADTSSQLVTAGRGTHATPRTSGGSGGQTLDDSDSYVTASYIQGGTNAGKLAVIYMSHHSSITIDQSKLVAGYTGIWIDPASGATSTATTGSTYNSATKGTNSDGQNDWVLVLGELSTSITQAVDVATLTLTGVDPTGAGTGATSRAVDVAALTLTGIDPTAAGTGASANAVDVGSLTLTGIDPTGAGSGVASTAADVATLTLAGQELAGGAGGAAADAATLTLTGIDVTAAGTGATSVAVDVASLTLTGIDPTASGTGAAAVLVDPAALTLTGVDPVGAGSGAAAKLVDVASLTLTGVELTATGLTNIILDVAILTLTGLTPGAAGSGATAVLADTAAVTLTGLDPAAAGTGVSARLVDTAALTLTGVDVIGTGYLPDTNPITTTVRASGNRTTVRASGNRATSRSSSRTTAQENR